MRRKLALTSAIALSLAAQAGDPWAESRGDEKYRVVINHEEQYSIWFADREVPLGWKPVGKTGTKQECLDYIEEVWTDMRPLSLKDKMRAIEEENARKGRDKRGG